MLKTSAKMVAIGSGENIPKCPKIYRHNWFDKAKTFWILLKKGFIGHP